MLNGTPIQFCKRLQAVRSPHTPVEALWKMTSSYAPPTLVYPLQDNPGVWLAGGLCNCCTDCENCCITCWVPCLTYAQNKKRLYGRGDPHATFDDELVRDLVLYSLVGTVSAWACNWVMGVEPRANLKKKYGLPQDGCGDCCTHFWCHYCALCQEARELNARPVTRWPQVAFPQEGAKVAEGYPA